jgi:trimeric autotransporter adhesin
MVAFPRSNPRVGPGRWLHLVLILAVAAACSDSTSPTPDPLDEGTWYPLAQGLTGSASTFLEWEGGLVAGGLFRTAGDQPARNVAFWDGALWHTMGTGLDGPVQGLARLEGELFAAGFFGPGQSRVHRWDGAEWQAVGMHQGGGILSLHVHQGSLYAQGSEAHRWTGSTWEPVEVAIDGDVYAAEGPMAIHDGDLVVGVAETENLARWDGAAWSWMERPSSLFALTAGGGELYAVGGPPHRWTGSGWEALAQTGMMVRAWAVHGGDLFLGFDGVVPQTGSIYHYVGRWSGSEWVSIPGEMDGQVNGLGSFEDTLLAGGSFVEIDENPFRGIARILLPGGAP